MILSFTVLLLFVILVNGWTDAPNAIAGCVSTRALSPGGALTLAAICNFSGAVAMAALYSGVAKTLFGMVSFGEDPQDALAALCSALVAVILWGVLAWRFGLPTSESHALISGMTGAALAQKGSLAAINGEEWGRVILGLLATTLPAYLFGFLIYRILLSCLANARRRTVMAYFRRTQILGAAGSAFMHGAQDSQKFMGVYLLGLALHDSASDPPETIPLSVILITASVMTLGTMIGGARIIKKVGCEMTDLDAVGGTSADLASTAVLYLCSVLGIPASTTHSKSCAIMGTGLCRRGSTNPRVVAEMLGAWILTFPACGIIGYALSSLFT